MFGGIGQIGLVVLGIMVLSNIMSGGIDLQSTLLMLPGLVLALTVHEYSHARASDRLGDPTPEQQGRLTLNPLAHMDPVGTICLLFGGFGWGRPVEINPSYYRNPARDSAIVSAAGPISNFILAFIMFLISALLIIFGDVTQSVTQIILTIVSSAAYMNIGLGLFNLLPFPPLDGSKILRYFLKGKALEFMFTLERYSMIIIIALFISKLPSKILGPLVDWVSTGMIYAVSWIIGLFM
ncbi:MAG: site-2 protease family protein [Clostridia bacterium]|nr:site-2 protease family protein [Clostridia bacterium]